jgi:hypothetical protein
MKEDVLKATRLELMIIWINLWFRSIDEDKAIIQRKALILKRNKFNMNSTLENFTLIQN